jgi:hypothetical protein
LIKPYKQVMDPIVQHRAPAVVELDDDEDDWTPPEVYVMHV